MSGATSTNTTNAAAAVAPEITAEWTVHAQLTLSSSAAKSVDSATAAKEEVPAHRGADRSHQTTAWVDGQTDNGGGGDVSSGGKVDLNFSQQPPATSSGTSATGNSGNPVKLVYKFSTTDHALPFVAAPAASYAQQNSASRERPVGKSNVIFNSDPSSPATVSSVFVQSPTGDGPQPPGIDGVTTGCSVNSQLFPKCTSTCSIVLTACTDLLPTADSIPIIINKCESTNNISVDKGTNFPEKTASNAKDVSCQTSDWETNAIQTIQTVEAEEGGSIRRRARAQRTITDDCLLSPPPRRRAEDSKFDSLIRKSVSPIVNPFISPTNTIRSQQSASASASAIKKKPRTVHIDVYCTGSDAETSCSSNDDDDDDDDGSLDGKSLSSHSSCSSGSRFDTSHMMELKSMAAAAASTSNPTQSQPIFESEEMRVRHKRAGKHEVPRRLMQQPIDQNTLSTIGSLKRSTSIGGGSGRQRASVAARRSVANDEINESKQILFNKHLGDMTKAAKVEDLSVYFRRDASDDAISSNYAMSNRSTRRDITGSSISSALASAGGLYEDDEDDMVHLAGDTESSNPQLNRSGTTATQSDSFEYENSEDRYRIHEMERVWNQQHWKSPSVERRLLELHNPRHASDDAEQRASMPRLLRSDSENNLTESDHSFVYDEAPTVPLSRAHDSNPSLNELSDSSPSTVKSASHPRPTERGRAILQQAILAATMQQQRQFSPVEGYTTEYLAIARRFGSLIKGRRKPGTHMGPVRNPECPCAHCRRWMMERDITSAGGPGVLRERAVSVDETMPHNIVDMRRHFHMRNLF